MHGAHGLIAALAEQKQRTKEKRKTEKRKKQQAADYTDEWYHMPGVDLAFRTFYVCTAKWGVEGPKV